MIRQLCAAIAAILIPSLALATPQWLNAAKCKDDCKLFGPTRAGDVTATVVVGHTRRDERDEYHTDVFTPILIFARGDNMTATVPLAVAEFSDEDEYDVNLTAKLSTVLLAGVELLRVDMIKDSTDQGTGKWPPNQDVHMTLFDVRDASHPRVMLSRTLRWLSGPGVDGTLEMRTRVKVVGKKLVVDESEVSDKKKIIRRARVRYGFVDGVLRSDRKSLFNEPSAE